MRLSEFIFLVGITAVVGFCVTVTSYANDESSTDDIIARGENIFINQCEICHGKGFEKGGTHRLRQRYKGSLTEYL